MTYKKELQDMLDLSCAIFNLIDRKADIMKKAGAEGELCNILKYELVAFLMCLSSADGRISRVEAQLIREYFNLGVYPIHIKELIQEQGIGSEVYYGKVPESLKLAVEVDNYLHSIDVELTTGLSEMVIELFKVFGKEMVIVDEKVKLEERLSWGSYITMMTKYAVENCDVDIKHNGKVIRPGEPINVKYEMSMEKINRIYSLYYGKLK